MGNIAIIPARSGSKGLKDKNIKPFCNKPLLAYSVEAAIGSGKYEVVHVSTDSEKYAEIAAKYGADVHFLRSPALSSDTADSWDVMTEVLERYKEEGREFETLTVLQPTSPLRSAKDIEAAFDLFRGKNANAVISVCEADHPPAWFHTLPQDGDMSAFGNADDNEKRRQDFSKHYRINGAIYLMRIPYFLEDHHNIFRERAYAFIMDKRVSVDIDDQFDFDVAEAIYKLSKDY
ncbi:MAG: acylneuraminate cytidylyltransferase family protein [Lachnospiraceae bacterium]|nr:acylneuraminate cytidylyltransferase family protein [Lachnospiraceae bacterium]